MLTLDRFDNVTSGGAESYFAAESYMLTVPLTSSIGKYRLIAELGSGGMANVYLAVMLARNGFSKLVVLKVPRDHVTDDPELLAMFVDEARIAARLNHANVVQTYEVAEHSGRDVIVMEYLEGHSLSEILSRTRKSGRPLPLGLHLRIVVEALQGLHYAHEATDYNGEPLKLVHRDVSPQNLFVTFEGQVKVLDFGVAKAATASHVTKAGTFKGKVRYMPPEQFIGTDIDRRADIFAIGVVLWEAAAGQRLWKGVTDEAVIANVLNGKVPSPRENDPNVDERLERIVQRALAFNRDDRYSTCLELQADLESFMDAAAMRVSTKDVGSFVSELFAETHRERLHIIDEQVRRANAESTGEYRVLAADEFPTGGPLSQSTPTPLASSSSTQPSAAPSVATDPARAKEGAPNGRSATKFIALLVAVVACVAIAILVTSRAQTSTSKNAVPSAEASLTTAPAPAPRAEVSVTLSAKPREATIFLDGEALSSNPYKKRAERDGSAHTVRVEAKGYATKSITVEFDSDKEVAVSLDRTPSPVVAAPRPPPVHAPAAPPPPKSTTVVATPESAPVAPPSESRPKRPDRRIDDKL